MRQRADSVVEKNAPMQVKLGASHVFCEGCCAKALVFFGFLHEKKLAKKWPGSAGVSESGGEGYGEEYPPPPPELHEPLRFTHAAPDVNSRSCAGQHIREASAPIGFGRHKVWQIASEQA